MVSMRQSLGINPEVSLEKLKEIKAEQLERGEPYDLDHVAPQQDDENFYAGL